MMRCCYPLAGFGLLLLLCAAVSCSRLAPEPGGPRLAAGQMDADYAGQELCTGCHQQENSHWSHTVHARAFQAPSAGALAARGCEACHGPGSAHVADPFDKSTIIAFTRASSAGVGRQNSMCLQCHAGEERLYWPGSSHQLAELACSDCHNPMARLSQSGLLREASVNSTCFGCHQQQRAEFQRRSHMPVPEGRMNCGDCHQPHGSSTPPLLAEVTVNQVCYQCHQEKRGPFLWEHAPVRESCMNCHTPHGSNHESQLVAARPFLCQRCHSNRGHPNDLLTRANLPGAAFPDARLVNRSCQNCHVQIHGSNHPSGVRFHR